MNGWDFQQFIIDHYYEQINDVGVGVEQIEPHYFDVYNKPEEFLYKTDSGGRFKFDFGQVVPQGTKSVIRYYSNCEVYLSSSKEETKKLWDKGDMKKLSENFIISTSRDNPLFGETLNNDSGIVQKIYDEKDNPVNIVLQDVESFQKVGKEGIKGDLLSKGSKSLDRKSLSDGN